MSIVKKLNYDGRNDTLTATINMNSDVGKEWEDHYEWNYTMNEILSDMGIQLSPGGSGLIEIPEDDMTEDGQSMICGTTYQANSSDRSTDQEMTKVYDTVSGALNLTTNAPIIDSDVPLTIDLSPGDRRKRGSYNSSSYKRKRKMEPKMYEIQPFVDPELEKKRLNAINAKRNRDNQKRKIEDLKKEVKTAERINKQSCKAIVRTNKIREQMRKRIIQLEKIYEEQEKQLHNKEIKNRQNSEKLNLLLEHIDLIATSFEDSNPAKRLLTNLLQRLSPDHSNFRSSFSASSLSSTSSFYTSSSSASPPSSSSSSMVSSVKSVSSD